MQTFLPYPDFAATVEVLDRPRLGAQRNEAKTILKALLGETAGYARHPATRAWAGYEQGLVRYALVCCDEWNRRGYQDLTGLRGWFADRLAPGPLVLPAWFGDDLVHASHRSNLQRKDITCYGAHGWAEPADQVYVWPEPVVGPDGAPDPDRYLLRVVTGDVRKYRAGQRSLPGDAARLMDGVAALRERTGTIRRWVAESAL